jgi:hypothetical protein
MVLVLLVESKGDQVEVEAEVEAEALGVVEKT